MADGKITIQSADNKLFRVQPEVGATGDVTVTLPKEGGMLTVDTEVVHKTGNETKTGTMTFMDNVGIGVAPSPWSSLFKSIDIGKAGFYQYNNNYMGMSQNHYYDGSKYAYKANGRAYDFTAGSIDGFIWRVAPDGIAGNAITWTNAMTLDVSGNLLLTSGTGGLGYGTGSGGTVTQLTSKGTTVTLNKPCGQIVMHNSSLAAGGEAAFFLNTTAFTVNDFIHVQLAYPYGDNYEISANQKTSSGCTILLKNKSAGSLSEAVVLKFIGFKGAIA